MDITHSGAFQAQRIAHPYTRFIELVDAGRLDGLRAFDPRQGKFDGHIQRHESSSMINTSPAPAAMTVLRSQC